MSDLRGTIGELGGSMDDRGNIMGTSWVTIRTWVTMVKTMGDHGNTRDVLLG